MSPEQLFSFDLSSILVVLGFAASPVSELRGAIPLAIIQFHFPWYYAFPLAVVGNLLPVPFILLFLDSVSRLLNKVSFSNRILNWLFERTRRRGKIIERYERIGLILFVAIPLPITGAWTGSFAAVLFGLKFKHAFLSIFIGVLIAGVIVTCVSLLGWTIFNLTET
ncbi:COG2426 family protein [Chloroflexota bacterium]